jgi:TRAP-type uncharacterized transport system fused permease subunit
MPVMQGRPAFESKLNQISKPTTRAAAAPSASALTVNGFASFFFADDIMRRAGLHNEIDLAIGTIGVLLVILAAQRVVGTPLAVVAGALRRWLQGRGIRTEGLPVLVEDLLEGEGWGDFVPCF